MKISFERTGGFAGMRMAITIDVDSLPDPDAASVRKLVANADFFNFAGLSEGKVIPDGFQYVVTIEGEGHQRTIRVTDGNIPDQLRPLLDDLSLRARSQRRI